MNKKKRRIAALVSGGVDSSVALKMAVDAGYDVTAFYLKIWLEDELSYLGSCPWQEDLAYVEALCKQLNVPLKVVSLQREYWDSVVQYTINEVRSGRTPNPDIMCNSRIKFGAFFDVIGDEYDTIVTGHYADVRFENGYYHLYQSKDPVKDQTYFLAGLSQEQLARVWFPLGSYTKDEVRAYAAQWGLSSANRKDSQGICFLGKIKFADFLHHHLGEEKGVLREYETGTDVGEHKGFWYYTIGQRHSIGLAGGPWYVVAKEPANNVVYISRSYYEAHHVRDSVTVGNINWLGAIPKALSYPADSTKSAETGFASIDASTVKLRHGPHMHRAKIMPDGDQCVITLLSGNDQGIAPGQYAVWYHDGRCVGSGVMLDNR